MRILALAITVLLSSPSLAEEPYEWKVVGSNPYTCSECTPSWALARSGYPSFVQELVLEMIELGGGEIGEVRSGQRFDFVTFGKDKPGVKKNVVAAWPEGASYATRFYRVAYQGVEYVVTHTLKCSNYGGWTSSMQVIDVVELPSPSLVYPAGHVPETFCPEDSSGCNSC